MSTEVTKTEELLTEEQAAPAAITTPGTLKVWRHRGKGPPYLKVSGKIRYRLSDIVAWLEGCRIVPAERRTPRRRAGRPIKK